MSIRGSEGGGHTIEDEGVPLTKRTKANFKGAGVSVADNAGDDSTEITIAGGAGIATTSNVGTGEGLAKALVADDAPFKSLIGELNRIILNGNANDITFTLASQVVATDKANLFGDFDQTFKDNRIKIESPDGLTPVTILNLQQTLARNLSIPILTANDTLAVLGLAQTFIATQTLNSFKGTGAVTVTDILDEDNMVSDSATKLVTQQSIKKYVDDNISGGSDVGCRVIDSSNQSIANNTYTVLNWDGEDYDTDGFHDNVTNNSRLTIPSGKGGKYLIVVAVRWASNSTGLRLCGLKKNGSEFARSRWVSGGTGELAQVCIQIVDLAVADYIEVRVRQSSGGSLDAVLIGIAGYFCIQKIDAGG